MDKFLFYFYRFKLPISFIFGMGMSLTIAFLSYPTSISAIIFPLIFYVSNFLLAYVGIGHLTGMRMISVYKDKHLKMQLCSSIKIIQKYHIKTVQFSLKNQEYEVRFQIETKSGIIGSEYEFLNIENIMIKPDKDYSVHMMVEELLLDNKVCERIIIPVSIDYFDLEDKFYLYKII